jgi:subtilase family serine protease
VRSIVGLLAAAGLAVAQSAAGASTAPAPPGRLAGSAVPFTTSLPATGLVPGGHRMTIQVWLAPRDPAGAARYATAVSTPGTLLFHRFLRPDAFTQRFGATTAEATAVTTWLRGADFTDVTSGVQRSYIQATAPVSVIDTALHIRLKYYRATRQVNAGRYRLYANDRAVQVPGALTSSILDVTGLDNEAPDLPLARGRPDASQKIPCSRYYGQHRAGHLPREFGVTSFPTSICGYSAGQLRRAYGANRSDDGRGQTIALVELGLTKDMFLTLRDYARVSHLPAPARSRYAELDLGRRSCPDLFYGEEQLDVEAAYDMAPGARELVVGGNSCSGSPFQNMSDALMRTLGGKGDHPLASIASISWEDPTPPTGAQERLTHTILIRAAAEGVGMYFASADAPGVNSPSDDPFATGVGGTSLGIGRSGNWLFETGWSTAVAGIRRHHWAPLLGAFAAGGGPSPRWAQPAYQKAIVPPALSRNGASRSVPDLSAVADPTTGMEMGELDFSGHAPPRLVMFPGGGTSLATPLVAGLVADAQQGHTPFGFLNPVLYRLAGTTAFHDALPENRLVRPAFRGVVCASANGLCRIGTGSAGPVLDVFDYQGHAFTRQVTLKGYDNMTGLGTPNGQAFIAALRRLEG